MEQITIIRKKARLQPSAQEKNTTKQPDQEKPKTKPNAKASLSIKMSALPDLKSEGKKLVKIPVRTGSLGFLQMHVKSKTYRKAREAVLNFKEEAEYVVLITANDEHVEKKNGMIICKGCALQVFEKKKKEKNDNLH